MPLTQNYGRISYGLGRHYHPFDELLWLFRYNSTNFQTTSGGPRDCCIVSEQSQEFIKRMIMSPKPCGHFKEFVKFQNNNSWLKHLQILWNVRFKVFSNSWKRPVSPKCDLVVDAWLALCFFMAKIANFNAMRGVLDLLVLASGSETRRHFSTSLRVSPICEFVKWF